MSWPLAMQTHIYIAKGSYAIHSTINCASWISTNLICTRRLLISPYFSARYHAFPMDKVEGIFKCSITPQTLSHSSIRQREALSEQLCSPSTSKQRRDYWTASLEILTISSSAITIVTCTMVIISTCMMAPRSGLSPASTSKSKQGKHGPATCVLKTCQAQASAALSVSRSTAITSTLFPTNPCMARTDGGFHTISVSAFHSTHLKKKASSMPNMKVCFDGSILKGPSMIAGQACNLMLMRRRGS